MPITNHIRDNWCRFQGELFPEIQDAVGPLLKKYQGFVMALEIACPENFILTSDVFLRNLLILLRQIPVGHYIAPFEAMLGYGLNGD